MRNFLKLISITTALLLVGTSNQIYSSEKRQIDIKSNTLISNAIEKKEIKTVTANGFGTTIESAAQNAAENALTNVVGSFLDVQVLLKEKTKISDGILSQTSIIKENINDYSQGSIKYFKILDVQEKDSIYIVSARVDVRIEDFRAYIKQLASDTTSIDQGLLTAISVEKSNDLEKIDLLKKVTFPVVKAEIIEINQNGEQQLLEDLTLFGCKYDDYIKCWGEQKGSNINVDQFSPQKTLLVPYVLEIKDDFFENAINILNNISDSKKYFSIDYPDHQKPSFGIGRNDYFVDIPNMYTKTRNIYVLKEINRERNTFPEFRRTDYPYLKLSFLNKYGQKVCTFLGDIYNYYPNDENFYNLNCLNSKVQVSFLAPLGMWNIIGNHPGVNLDNAYLGGARGVQLFKEIRMFLILEPSEEFLNSVKSINFEFVQK